MSDLTPSLIDTKGIVTNLLAAGIWLLVIVMARFLWRFFKEDQKDINDRISTISTTLSGNYPLTFEVLQCIKMLLDSLRTIFAFILFAFAFSTFVGFVGITGWLLSPTWSNAAGFIVTLPIQLYCLVMTTRLGLKINYLQNRMDARVSEFIARRLRTVTTQEA
jgi:hypothetical protein